MINLQTENKKAHGFDRGMKAFSIIFVCKIFLKIIHKNNRIKLEYLLKDEVFYAYSSTALKTNYI